MTTLSAGEEETIARELNRHTEEPLCLSACLFGFGGGRGGGGVFLRSAG